jgi:inorganic pyrophosphatase
MPNLLKIPTWADEQSIHAVIETPRGSTCKLDFDPKPRVFTLAKPFWFGWPYPSVRLGASFRMRDCGRMSVVRPP